ncbi:hypothetical protein GSI_14171 [Ganoderma sinense ZZ0214-1]|uniref:Uncharacterized protein n=1 Tax=Ganoderma sinense ZZ0214-1 TaxID=1077348 RepID=A0A2G8RSC9_9APHY|nr:hypothetical protein GSI_14171 [Ganoderma sinense ZZ0214-1]
MPWSTLAQPQTTPTAADPTIYVGLCQTMPSATTTGIGSSPLDKLAVELIAHISFYACTDGGPTGCALSLVSKRIRAASRPARFFSVSLTTESSAQLKQFLACYQAECARATDALPRVQHLCISLFGREQGDAPAYPMAHGAVPPVQIQARPAAQPAPTSRAEFLARMQRQTQQWRSAQDRLDEGFSHVVPALIRAVAPDLRSLTFVQARWRVTGSVPQCCFAHLRELTLVGGDMTFLPFALARDGRPQFPSLRRLHHNLAFAGAGLSFLEWAAHAPNLTHLRVSRLDSHPRVIVDTLDQVIGDHAAEEYFPHLQHVTIQPNSAPVPSNSNVDAFVEFREFLEYLERLKERAKAPVVVLPPVEQSIIYPGVDRRLVCLRRLKRQWMERLEGEGPGCWEEGVEGKPLSHH